MVSVEVHSPHEETVVPAVGDIVTAKVLSVNQRWVDATNDGVATAYCLNNEIKEC